MNIERFPLIELYDPMQATKVVILDSDSKFALLWEKLQEIAQ